MRLQKNEVISYRKLSKCYTEKKHKKGLKIAENLLRNEHSPIRSKILAWKALFRGHLYDPEGGLDIVREALDADDESAMVWFAHGKLSTMKGDFQKAIESYEHALTQEPDNVHIMKSLSLVQVHVNDLDGFAHWTGQIVRSFMNRRSLSSRRKNYWIWYAVALHMSGDLLGALTILNSCDELRSCNKKRFTPFEQSELLLYQNQLIRESGEKAKALEHILENRDRILDARSADEIIVELLIENKRDQDALIVNRSLIKRNPNNRRYYENIFATLKLNSAKIDVLEHFIQEYPDALTPKALMLKVSSGSTFHWHLRDHINDRLKKGALSLFESIKHILEDEKKKEYVFSYLNRHEELVTTLDSESASTKLQAEQELIANYICKAKILDWEEKHAEALSVIQKALLLNPLNADGYLVKAQILKHAMNPTEACKAVEKAQRMDPKDRYLELKLIRYVLKADIIDRAEEMYSDLYKYDDIIDRDGSPSLWYLYEKAAALQRMGRYEEALEHCARVEALIDKLEINAFELHTFCREKLTVRSYEDFVNSMRKWRTNKYYKSASILAVNLAFKLHDTQATQIRSQKLKPWERTSSSISKSPSSISSRSNVSRRIRSKTNLARTGQSRIDNPLLFVETFVKSLQKHHSDCIETHLLAFEYNRRIHKPVEMVQCLLTAKNNHPEHPALLMPIIQFQKLLQQWGTKGSLPKERLTTIAELGSKVLWKEKNAEEMLKQVLLAEDKDLLQLFEAGKALYFWDQRKKDSALRVVTYLGLDAVNLNAAVCRKILDELQAGTFGDCKEEAENYRKNCKELFKLSTIFDIGEVKEARRKDLLRTLDNRNKSS